MGKWERECITFTSKLVTIPEEMEEEDLPQSVWPQTYAELRGFIPFVLDNYNKSRRELFNEINYVYFRSPKTLYDLTGFEVFLAEHLIDIIFTPKRRIHRCKIEGRQLVQLRYHNGRWSIIYLNVPIRLRNDIQLLCADITDEFIINVVYDICFSMHIEAEATDTQLKKIWVWDWLPNTPSINVNDAREARRQQFVTDKRTLFGSYSLSDLWGCRVRFSDSCVKITYKPKEVYPFYEIRPLKVRIDFDWYWYISRMKVPAHLEEQLLSVSVRITDENIVNKIVEICEVLKHDVASYVNYYQNLPSAYYCEPMTGVDMEWPNNYNELKGLIPRMMQSTGIPRGIIFRMVERRYFVPSSPICDLRGFQIFFSQDFIQVVFRPEEVFQDRSIPGPQIIEYRRGDYWHFIRAQIPYHIRNIFCTCDRMDDCTIICDIFDVCRTLKQKALMELIAKRNHLLSAQRGYFVLPMPLEHEDDDTEATPCSCYRLYKSTATQTV